MRKGWVKNYRSLLDWEWYHDLPTRVLFQHLLLVVNWEEKKWQGKKIRKGEIITSISHLANDSDLSEWQVRRALQNLQSTGEVEVTTTNRYSHILIKNFKKYQETKKQTTSHRTDKQKDTEKVTQTKTKQTTNKPQTNHKQTTTTKEYIKNKRIKEDNIYVVIDNKKYRRDDPNRPLTLEERKDLGLA